MAWKNWCFIHNISLGQFEGLDRRFTDLKKGELPQKYIGRHVKRTDETTATLIVKQYRWKTWAVSIEKILFVFFVPIFFPFYWVSFLFSLHLT